MMRSAPSLAVVIVSWNTGDLLRRCLTSLLPSHRRGSAEIIVVDNGSRDGSAAVVERYFPGVRLIRNADNAGFARANNQGIAASATQYVLLLNSDTIVPDGALEGLVSFMEQHPEAGAVGPRLLRLDGTPQPFAFGSDPTISYLLARGLSRLVFRRPLHDWGTSRVQPVQWVSGACLMLRRAAIEKVGALDEGIFMYFEDSDLCRRLRHHGWRVYFDPEVSITHIGGKSLAKNPRARDAYYRSLDYFHAKHYPRSRWLMRIALLLYRLMVRH